MTYLTINHRNPWGLDLWSPLFSSSLLDSSILKGFSAEEKDDAYELSVELPGYKPSEVEVTIDKGVLTVRAENKKRGSTQSSINLWKNVDADRIDARVEDGLLTVTLNKKQEDKPRKIALKH